MSAVHPYTQDPTAGPYFVFPTHAHQILSNCVHILGVSILAYCFARRTEHEQLFAKQGWTNMTWTKFCVMLLFIDSWIFLAFSGILVNGVGLSYSTPICSLGIYACIFFYAGSKALIYGFLVERVWIIWSAGKSVARRHSTIYKICAAVVTVYIAVFTLMIVGRIAYIRDDGSCVIGLEKFASIPLLTYDLFVNVFLTSLFIWPLYREHLINQRLRNVAWRTLVAAGVALTTSSVNMFILTILDGKQLGWVCLGSCATDVTINAVVLYWVTAGAHRENNHRNSPSLPSFNVPLSLVGDPDTCTETPKPVAPDVAQPAPSYTTPRRSELPTLSLANLEPARYYDSPTIASPASSRNGWWKTDSLYRLDCDSLPLRYKGSRGDLRTIDANMSLAGLASPTSPAADLMPPLPGVEGSSSYTSRSLPLHPYRRPHPERRRTRVLHAVRSAIGLPWRQSQEVTVADADQHEGDEDERGRGRCRSDRAYSTATHYCDAECYRTAPEDLDHGLAVAVKLPDTFIERTHNS